MKNRKAVEPPTTYRFQTTWTSGTRDKASGKEALWDRFLSYGYDCHSLTTRVTFRSAVGEKGISAMNETKKKKNGEKRKREGGGEREREKGQTVRTLDVTAGLSFDWHSRSFERRLCRGKSLPCRNDFSLIVSSLVTSRSHSTWPLLCVSLRRVKTKQIHSIRFLWFSISDGKVNPSVNKSENISRARWSCFLYFNPIDIENVIRIDIWKAAKMWTVSL